MKITTNNSRRFSVKQTLFIGSSFLFLGTAIELYLLHHYEDFFQLIPLVSILVSLVVLVLLHIRSTLFLNKLFVVLMVITALAGLYGVFLHLQANFQFEQEMTPTHTNWELFTESLSGAIPALAPGSLVAFSLIGYSYSKLIK